MTGVQPVGLPVLWPKPNGHSCDIQVSFWATSIKNKMGNSEFKVFSSFSGNPTIDCGWGEESEYEWIYSSYSTVIHLKYTERYNLTSCNTHISKNKCDSKTIFVCTFYFLKELCFKYFHTTRCHIQFSVYFHSLTSVLPEFTSNFSQGLVTSLLSLLRYNGAHLLLLKEPLLELFS